MKKRIRSRRLLRASFCSAFLFFAAPVLVAHSSEKIPREVIDQAAAQGTVLVLVGLDVPWEMESRLSETGLQMQRAAIASVQSDLLNQLEGRNYKLIRRYQEIPGIALEVGADALAELARLSTVTNVLLDRPAISPTDATASGLTSSGAVLVNAGSGTGEKVPSQIFKRAATEGTVLVLAGLRTPWQREDQLSEDLLALQRTAIHGVQSYVLAELAGTRYKVMRLYQRIPGIALRVGLDALKVLERSPAVTNVVLDRPAQRSQ
jgi:hypothetical protein